LERRQWQPGECGKDVSVEVQVGRPVVVRFPRLLRCPVRGQRLGAFAAGGFGLGWVFSGGSAAGEFGCTGCENTGCGLVAVEGPAGRAVTCF